MVIINIQNIITFIAINLDDPNLPNIDEFISDAWIRTDTTAHKVDIRTHDLTQICDVVHK